jgi:nucleotide-binding universal stress UspA family protein
MTVATAYQHSPAGRAALVEAAREAQVRGDDLVVISVVESLDLDSRAAVEAGLTDQGGDLLRSNEVGEVTWRSEVVAEDEDVTGAVLAAVERAHANLLVIGARQRSPVGKALTGSVSQQLILEAPLPVLVVKAG